MPEFKMLEWRIVGNGPLNRVDWLFAFEAPDGGRPYIVKIKKEPKDNRNVFQAWDEAKADLSEFLRREVTNGL